VAVKDQSVEFALTQLQATTREEGSSNIGAGMSFRIPADLQRVGARMLHIGSAVVEAMDEAEYALASDLRFEYMTNTLDTLRGFVAWAWFDRDSDHVGPYVAQHAREPDELTCFVPIEYLTVTETMTLAGIRLLPAADANIPGADNEWFALERPIGSVAAIPVTGTNLGNMASRARDAVATALRIARIGLRDHRSINDRQLRFRPATSYAFTNGVFGWADGQDAAYDLTLTPEVLGALERRGIWGMPPVPQTDVQKKADLAVRWMERARFATEPLVALLYLFYALEALLGDKSERLKADGLAFRQLVLSHVVTGGFRHPNTTWLLYDQVRSAAVHGEVPPVLEDGAVERFEWAVRDTLNEYLAFAASQGITRRGRLMRALTNHPDVALLADWIRENAGHEWQSFLEDALA